MPTRHAERRHYATRRQDDEAIYEREERRRQASQAMPMPLRQLRRDDADAPSDAAAR